MPATLLRASINRHLPFLTPGERRQLGANPGERNATARTIEIARRMGALLPGASK